MCSAFSTSILLFEVAILLFKVVILLFKVAILLFKVVYGTIFVLMILCQKVVNMAWLCLTTSKCIIS